MVQLGSTTVVVVYNDNADASEVHYFADSTTTSSRPSASGRPGIAARRGR
ncbi:hypothetical protein [Amycolatopsis sp. NPDC051903]